MASRNTIHAKMKKRFANTKMGLQSKTYQGIKIFRVCAELF